MAGLRISDVARVSGLRPSALRYYEAIGLLPAPPRDGGQRRYDERALHRLALVARARQLGFSLAEIRELLNAFPESASAGARWSRLAARKLSEVNDLLTRVQAMHEGLVKIQHCGCATLDECGRRIFQKSCQPAPAVPRRRRRSA